MRGTLRGTCAITACALLMLAPLASASAASERAPESYQAKHWSTANGLPQNTINDLLQTDSGELWIATFAGLLRFDGIQFVTFGIDTLPGLPSNRITALAPDGAGGVWVATQTGDLLRFDGGEIVEAHAALEPPDEILALARAGDGSLWTQARSGAVRRIDAGRWTLVVPAGSPGEYEGVCANRDGSIAAAVGDELVLFEPSGARRAALRAPSAIVAVSTGSDESTWLGLVDGLARARHGTIERVLTSPPTTARVNAITEDGRGGLWLGTRNGPAHVDPGARDPVALRVHSEAVLPGGFDVRSLVRDREGNVWLGGTGQGLVRLRPHHLESFGPAGSRTNVRAIASDGAGGAWVANECQGLVRLVDGEREARPEPLPALDDGAFGAGRVCVQSLLRDRSGRVWLGWNERVLRRAAGAETAFVPVLDEQRFPLAVGPMAEAPSGDVWIASGEGRLVRVGADDVVLEELDVGVPIVSLAAASDGSVWIGGASLVLRLRDGALERYDETVGLPRGDVRDLFLDPDGSVWTASYGGGLGRIRGGRATALTRRHGLPDDSLTHVLDDGRERLWLLSNLGLCVADRSALAAVADGRAPRIDPIVLGPETGMPEGTQGNPAGFRDEQGRLWFGSIAGVVRVDPRRFPFHRTEPPVRIEHVDADGRALALNPAMQVPPGTRRLLFAYTAFALSAPERVHFRHRLDGFDTAWHEAGTERLAAYTALAPGDYTFRVEARSEEGVWSAAPATLELEVLPQWWQRLSVRVAAVLGVLALLFALHRRRVEVVSARAQVLLAATEGRARAETRESRLREELAHAGRVATAGELATSLAHEVNQPLAAIVANAQAGRRFLARDALERVELDAILGDIAQQGQRASEVIRSLRAFLRKHTAARRELDLGTLVRETLPLVRRELEEQQVELVLDLGPELSPVHGDPVELQQVLVNLVQNACEALAAHAGTRRITVRTRAHAGRVGLEVEDSGPGLAPEIAGRVFQAYVTTKPAGMGLGLAICRSIVEAHGGRVSARAAQAGGTLFCVDLPASAVEVVA